MGGEAVGIKKEQLKWKNTKSENVAKAGKAKYIKGSWFALFL